MAAWRSCCRDSALTNSYPVISRLKECNISVVVWSFPPVQVILGLHSGPIHLSLLWHTESTPSISLRDSASPTLLRSCLSFGCSLFYHTIVSACSPLKLCFLLCSELSLSLPLRWSWILLWMKDLVGRSPMGPLMLRSSLTRSTSVPTYKTLQSLLSIMISPSPLTTLRQISLLLLTSPQLSLKLSPLP